MGRRAGWCAAAGLAALLGSPAAGADRVVEGELLRVDLGKRLIVVRPSSGAPREVDVRISAATVLSASGRALRLEELKTGERVVAACDGAQTSACTALRVRTGPARSAVPPAPRSP